MSPARRPWENASRSCRATFYANVAQGELPRESSPSLLRRTPASRCIRYGVRGSGERSNMRFILVRPERPLLYLIVAEEWMTHPAFAVQPSGRLSQTVP